MAIHDTLLLSRGRSPRHARPPQDMKYLVVTLRHSAEASRLLMRHNRAQLLRGKRLLDAAEARLLEAKTPRPPSRR